MQIANQIIAVQCLIGVLVSAGWMLKGSSAALAAMCGAAIAVLPALYLRWRMFQALRLTEEPRALVGQVYRGQSGKFVMTTVLFAVVVSKFPQEFLPVMTAYVACLAAYMIAGLAAAKD